MNKVRYLLVDDLGNKGGGVLVVAEDVVIANHLRRGVLDARLMWTIQPYNESSPGCEAFVDWRFCRLSENMRSEDFLRKREILRLRLPAFLRWQALVIGHLNRDRLFPLDTDWYMASELQKSTSAKPSEGLLDYAETSNMPVGEVYEFFKLQVAENVSKRLMIHALAMKHANAINDCMNSADVTKAFERMKIEFLG